MARSSLSSQVVALLKRNITLKKRNKKGTLQEIFTPVYFVVLLAVIKKLTQPGTEPAIHSFPERSFNDSFYFLKSGLIYAAPNTSHVASIMQQVVAQLQHRVQLEYQLYRDLSDAEIDYKHNSSIVVAGVQFDVSADGSYAYTLRLPYGQVPATDPWRHFVSAGECRQQSAIDYSCSADRYLYFGFAVLQATIDNVILKETTNRSDVSLPARLLVQKMPKFEFTASFEALQTLASIYLVMAYSPFITFLTIALVHEKERKIKEAMRMMGMRDTAFWLSWSIVYVVFILVVTIIVVVIAAVAKFFQHSNMFLFFIMMFLYGLSIINLAFAITPFFSRSEVAGALASLMTMLFSLLYLAVSLTREGYNADGPVSNIPGWGQWLMSLISPIALALAVDQGLYLDIAKGGMTFETTHIGQFPLYASITMLAVDTVLYALLAFYLDNIVPNEYGLRRPPWFCFMKSYWRPRQEMSPDELELFAETGGEMTRQPTTGSHIETVPAALANKDVLRIFDVHKEFKTRDKTIKAINGLSLDIYEGQITALLGHNGAGKTTLINVLTGMSPPTSGSATVYGLDVTDSSDMTAIRGMTGVCPQHSILFDDLTCMEHLAFYGALKGVPSASLSMEIAQCLEDVGLKEQKNTFGRQLSGGQKRKLSVGIALIGDPKVIFLDEPTAGMDPASRRHLWSLLKARQAGKVILLTTHFMDEADILADRKAIMSKGKLRCCGSSLFLKNKFGIGYHLSMLVAPSARLESITELVESHVPDSSLQRQHGKELFYTLPLESVSKFAELFEDLDRKVEEGKTGSSVTGIRSYGVSMTTLEEVFLKLGEEDQADEEVNLAFTGDHTVPPAEGINLEAIIATANIAGQALYSQQFWSLVRVNFLKLLGVKVKLFFQLVMPLVFIVAGSALARISPGGQTGEPAVLTLSPDMYLNTSASRQLPSFLYATLPGGEDLINSIGQLGVETEPYTGMASYLYDHPPHHTALNVRTMGSMTVMYNTTAVHSLVLAINLLTNAFLQMAAAGKGNVTVRSQPWPRTSLTIEQFSGSVFGSTIMLGMAMAVIPAGFAMSAVRDRVGKMKSQLRISGVTMNIYWASTFFSDFLQFLTVAVLAVFILLAFQVESLVQHGAILCLILLYFFYIPVNMLLAYNLSFMFDKIDTAESTLPTLFAWMSFLPYIAVGTLDMTNHADIARTIHYVACALDPPYTICGGLYYINRIYILHSLGFSTLSSLSLADYFAWSSNIPITYVFSIFHAVWLYFMLRFLEIFKTGGDLRDVLFLGSADTRSSSSSLNPDVPDDEDSDVKREREELQDYTPSQQGPVVVAKGLRKEFWVGEKKLCRQKKDRLKVAVRNSNFKVEAGEVFGLLGPNGAGKTTTLNMIIAEEGPSSGKVYIAGNDVRSSLSSAFKAMGYCPQHDPLWEFITLEQHLHCYAKVRGVPPQHVRSVANYLMDALHIREHAKKIAKTLSGGTKRKLSYAMSMLGTPRVVLLDEPSTGMDPRSKRFLWDTISASFEGSNRGAILTTHYMEEADALCSRVSIMVNGRMQCLGSTQQLKSKYGSGYMLEVKGSSQEDLDAQEEQMSRIRQFVMHLFPDATCMEWFGDRAIYRVPQCSVASLGTIFSSLERGKTEYNIEEYSFSQASLEQVFLEFARYQCEEDDKQVAAQNEDERNVRSLLRSLSQSRSYNAIAT